MKKMFAVLKREYLAAVRKKMFIFMTLFFPVLMSALMVLPGLMMAKGMGEKQIVVVDGTGELGEAFEAPLATRTEERRGRMPSNLVVQYMNVKGKNVESEAKTYIDRISSSKSQGKVDGVLVIPPNVFDGKDVQMAFYSRSSTDLVTHARLERAANRVIQKRRFVAKGIDEASIAALTRDVPVDSVQVSKSGEQKKGGSANFIIGFLFAAFLIMPSLIYGMETMRGIIQEKTDRVVEILISSMSPTQLLSGKITGIALVGLTQITVWLIIAAVAASFGATTAAMAGINVTQFVRPMMFVYFILFFLLAYFTFVCIYAIAGAACNTEKEAQQLIAPISMIMMLPWFLMVGIITNPDSALSVGFSLAPVFGPITMFVRTLVSEPPVSHVLTSIAVSLVTIAVFYWATAKIFRVGILSYGKRPTIPELIRWVRVA
jgi:ABC-2 type transport system permease protein